MYMIKFCGQDREYIEVFPASSFAEAIEKADLLTCGQAYDLKAI